MNSAMQAIIGYLVAIIPIALIIFAFCVWLLKYIIREAVKEALRETGLTKKE